MESKGEIVTMMLDRCFFRANEWRTLSRLQLRTQPRHLSEPLCDLGLVFNQRTILFTHRWCYCIDQEEKEGKDNEGEKKNKEKNRDF